MSAAFTSHMIMDAPIPAETMAELRQHIKVAADVDHIVLCVFEVRIDGRRRYCCWSGGKVDHDNPSAGPLLTPVGKAAMDTLRSLPFLPHGAKTLVFQEVRLGKTPLQQKVLSAFRRTADIKDALLCFVGDLEKELDGHMGKTFNLGEPTDIEQCTAAYQAQQVR